MGDQTDIEWADATWNPIVGCDVCSPGCANCYAMGQAYRLLDKPRSHYAGTTRSVNGKAVWTGKIELAPPHIVTKPMRWRRPRRIFVNSMGDLFHERVPVDWMHRTFTVMACTPTHQYLVLTKRAARMRSYIDMPAAEAADRLADAAAGMWFDDSTVCGIANWVNGWARWLEVSEDGNPLNGTKPRWPLPNVWLGVSVEDQRRAEERIPDLLATPAALRWISAEPLLEPVDLEPWLSMIDWVVVGGESGRDARAMHPDWARSVRDQCQAAGVPHFFKGWGEWAPVAKVGTGGTGIVLPNHHYFPDTTTSRRVGKKAAGRLLDGREWNEFPDVR